jgi:16S rRNA G1207 methylase RsmC
MFIQVGKNNLKKLNPPKIYPNVSRGDRKQMPQNPSHYFTSPDHSPRNVKKIFTSVRLQSMALQTTPHVFSPSGIDKGTQILIENMILPDAGPNINLLDLGAGYGPICIWLHKEYSLRSQLSLSHPPIPQIYASEVNDRASWLLNRNKIANDCHNLKILKGDICDHINDLREKQILFNAVYSNPPLKVGHENLLKIFGVVMERLDPSGFIQYVHKKKLGAEGFLNKLKTLQPDWQMQIQKKSGGFYVIVLAPNELPFIPTPKSSSGYF